MKKKLILCCLLGAPVGLCISTVISIIISLAVGDGNYYPVVPQLAADAERNKRRHVADGVLAAVRRAWAGGRSYGSRTAGAIEPAVTHLLICSPRHIPVAPPFGEVIEKLHFTY